MNFSSTSNTVIGNNQEVPVWRQVPLGVCLFSWVCRDCRFVCLTRETKQKESRRLFKYRRRGPSPTGRKIDFPPPPPSPPKIDPSNPPPAPKNELFPPSPAKNPTPSLKSNRKNEKIGLIDSTHDRDIFLSTCPSHQVWLHLPTTDLKIIATICTKPANY